MKSRFVVSLLTASILTLTLAMPTAARSGELSAREQAMADRLTSLEEGESAVLGTVDGYRLIASRNAGQLTIEAVTTGNVSSDGTGGGGIVAARAPTWCTYAVASFLWGLGAGFIGLMALLGVTITGPFGIVLTPAMLGWIAGFMGSWSVLLSAVSFYIC